MTAAHKRYDIRLNLALYHAIQPGGDVICTIKSCRWILDNVQPVVFPARREQDGACSYCQDAAA